MQITPSAFASALVLAALATAQFSPQRLPMDPDAAPWPPRPENIVTINPEALEVDQGISLTDVPPQGEVVLLQVPANKWFVLNHVGALSGSGNVAPNRFDIWESKDGVLLDRKGALQASGFTFDPSPLGWVFQPGSTVVLKNDSSGTFSAGTWGMVGYYVDA